MSNSIFIAGTDEGDEKSTSLGSSGSFSGKKPTDIDELRKDVQENVEKMKDLGEKLRKNVKKTDKQDKIISIGYLVIVITMLGVAISFFSMTLQFTSFMFDYDSRNGDGTYYEDNENEIPGSGDVFFMY